MPKLVHSVPKYRKHKASGQAVVTLNGTVFYLGRWKSKASEIEYDRLIAEWAANRRQLSADPFRLTIVELIARYWKFAERHYRKNGEPTHELNNIKYALRLLKRLYGHTLVRDFGPLALKVLQQEMIGENLSRGVINSRIGKIKRVFRWAVSEQLAPPSLCHALATVMGLQQGRTEARETLPVRPVENNIVDATVPFLPPIVADMVRFQRLTGCRPSEVCLLRPCDLDRSSEVWSYRPASHKNEHHGKERVIFVGPQAQQVLLRYLLRDAQAYCFSPQESVLARKAALRAKRTSKVQPSQIDRSRPNQKRKPKERYTRTSYLWAIRRACDKAIPAPKDFDPTALKAWRKANWWSPNQLRHAAGTEIRRRYGLEAAQVVLGHSKADTTQVYAERDLAKAEQVMKEVG